MTSHFLIYGVYIVQYFALIYTAFFIYVLVKSRRAYRRLFIKRVNVGKLYMSLTLSRIHDISTSIEIIAPNKRFMRFHADYVYTVAVVVSAVARFPDFSDVLFE